MSAVPESLILLDPQAAADALLRFGFAEDAAAFQVPLPVIAGPPAECWLGASQAQQGEREGIVHVSDGHHLIGELRYAAAEDPEALGAEAYTRLLGFLSTCGYPQLLRTWNYLDRLNHGLGDAERYRRFCVGRHRAIAAPGFETRLPAATVIGTRAPGLVLQFLAGRKAGLQVENPRQTSAFRYPRDYGPISPSFSRATLVGHSLLVSGTAAVVGHATQHPHDALAQTDEILANLEALLTQAGRMLPADPAGQWRAQALRLYLRDEDDSAPVLRRLRAHWSADTPITVLRGDISRADLAVEIEGVWSREAEAPAALSPQAG